MEGVFTDLFNLVEQNVKIYSVCYPQTFFQAPKPH